jgi:hypothetical protein
LKNTDLLVNWRALRNEPPRVCYPTSNPALVLVDALAAAACKLSCPNVERNMNFWELSHREVIALRPKLPYCIVCTVLMNGAESHNCTNGHRTELPLIDIDRSITCQCHAWSGRTSPSLENVNRTWDLSSSLSDKTS